MTKTFVDKLIHNMKKANIITKTSPWMVEGIGEKQMNIRYAGLKIKDDWIEICSDNNNIMLKFIIDKNSAWIEFYLANKPPFLKIISKRFADSDKWEILLGELKRSLKRDKADFINHNENIGNLYVLLKPHLK